MRNDELEDMDEEARRHEESRGDETYDSVEEDDGSGGSSRIESR